MATNHNKGKNSGLRILWIPGRKKHNRKGQYDSTNKRIDYSVHQKRNQQWSLGGSKTQEKIVQGNLSEISEVAPACTSIAASCVAGAGVLHNIEQSSSTTNDNSNLDKKLINGNISTEVSQEDPKASLSPENKTTTKKKTDEKIVNYIYYSLMCCECSIS